MGAEEESKKQLCTTMEGEEEKEKWVKHYSSKHQILLVGEGDFSFSLSLALAFGSASNIVATSLDTYDAVIAKYKKGKSNLENLKKLGATLFYGVDATKMIESNLKLRKFDRIIFNFPHAGFYGREENPHMIEIHQKLVDDFFGNANCMIRTNGEIHVAHKTSPASSQWNIEELARRNCLELIERVPFKKQDYPGYSNKRGHDKRCDEPFLLGECYTFRFRICPVAHMSAVTSQRDLSRKRSREVENNYPINKWHQITKFRCRHYQASSKISMTDHLNIGSSHSTFRTGVGRQVDNDYDVNFNVASGEFLPAAANHVNFSCARAWINELKRYMEEGPVRSLQHSIIPLRGLQQPLSIDAAHCPLSLTMGIEEFPGYMHYASTNHIISKIAKFVDGYPNEAWENHPGAVNHVNLPVHEAKRPESPRIWHNDLHRPCVSKLSSETLRMMVFIHGEHPQGT